jgi:dihydrofolate reductase
MFNRVSSDGRFAAQDGSLDWVVPEPEIDRLGVAGMQSTDTVLFGRRTYEMFASFWPSVYANPDSARNPHGPGGASPELRAMATWLNDTKKLVFSRTLREASWHNTEILGEFSASAIETLEQRPGEGIIIFGSGSIVSLLSEHGLIDEYRLIVTPVVLGDGTPWLRGVSKRIRLALLEAKAYPSGNVMLRYARTA